MAYYGPVRPVKIASWIAGGVAMLGLVAFFAFAGTYVVYFFSAMQRPPRSPFSVTCTQVAASRGDTLPVRLDIANTGRKDVVWINLAIFASGAVGRNLSDWNYALETRVPAAARMSKVVPVPLPDDYRKVRISGLSCNVINARFADGSQQSYGPNTDAFP